jgi:endonuclease YncB( thermonuclease family)
MAMQNYKQSTSRKIFTNHPFRNGMVYEDMTLNERQLKTSINYDISNTGDYGYPRGAFVNAVLHTGLSTIKLPNIPILQRTNLGASFLIASDYLVNTEEYVNQDIGATATGISNTPLTTPFGLHIIRLGSDVGVFNNKRGFKSVFLHYVYDGDTIYVKDTPDGTSYPVRFLGIDTPEMPPLGFDYMYDSVGKMLYRGTDGTLWSWGVHESFQDDLALALGQYYFAPFGDVVNLMWAYYDVGLGVWETAVAIPNINYTTMTDTQAIINYTLARKAKQRVIDLLAGSSTLIIEYDPLSKSKDVYERELAYAYTNSYVSINAHLVAYGLAKTAYNVHTQLHFDLLKSVEDNAKTNNYGVWNTSVVNSVPSVIDAGIVAQLTSHDPTTIPYEVLDDSFIKDCEDVTYKLNTDLYDTKSYLEPTKVKTTLFSTAPGDVIVQFLQNSHVKEGYEFDTYLKEVPHVDNTWRNATTLLGRILHNGVVKYRGPITVQYDGEYHNIIIVRPKEILIGSQNLNDATSIVFNAFSENPYVYKDLLQGDPEVGYFAYPAIMSSLIYDRILTEGNKDDVRVLKSFNAQQQCYIKPYIAFPLCSATDYDGTYMRYLFTGREKADEGWFKIGSLVGGVPTYDATAIPAASTSGSGLKTFDFTETAGKAVTIELETRYLKFTATNTGSGFGVVRDSKTGLKYDYEATYELKASIDVLQYITYDSMGISYAPYDGYAPVTFTITNKDTSANTSVKSNFVVINTGTISNPVYLGTLACQFKFEGVVFTLFKTDFNMHAQSYSITTVVDNVYRIHKSVSATQIVFNTGVSYVDQQDMLATYDVWKATDIALFDRSLILYGPHMGGHAIQFLEFDDFSLAPFPFGQIMFDRPIIHVHEHRGSLYIFSEDGIWIMHSGLSYIDMRRTFAYAGISLHPVEKASVVTVGNNVFVLHDNKGYVIRTNQMVQDASDIFTQVLSTPVDTILDTPRLFIRDRLQYGYGLVVGDTSNIDATFMAVNYNNELHLYGTYFIEDIDMPLLINYIYDIDKKRWRMYDSIVGGVPIAKTSDRSTKTYGLIMLNNLENTFATYAQYMHYLPENNKGYKLGDATAIYYTDKNKWEVAINSDDIERNLSPIACYFDTGALGFNTMHAKRIRRIYVDVVNISGNDLQFKIMPYVDGVHVSNDVEVTAILDAYGDLMTDVDVNYDALVLPRVYNLIAPGVNAIEGFNLTEHMLSTRNRVRIDLRTNVTGRLPGFIMMVPTTDTYNITHYGLVFRTQSAR